jgi:DNA-binding transcriptional MocR family regulator
LDFIVAVGSLISKLGDWQSRRGALKMRLRDAIAELILSGELTEGTRLPSERHLADAVAVSRNTATGTYALLVEDGLVQQRRGSGCVVRIDRQNVARLTRRSREVSEIFALREAESSENLIDLSLSSIKLLPEFAHLAAFDATQIAALDCEEAYNPYGLQALREAIARTFTARGLPTGPQEIMVTTGGQQGIDLTIRLFVERGDSVAVESPTFFVALDALRAAGARLHALPEYDRWKSLPDALIHTNARLMYIIPTLHNPTGRSMSNEERRFVAAASAALQVPVIEDVSLENLAYDGIVPPLVAQFAEGENVIVVGSLNKEFWSGTRIGWIRAHGATIGRLARLKTTADLTTSLWSQAVALRAFECIDEIRAARRAQLAEHSRLVERLVRQHLPDWHFEVPAGSFCLWVRLPLSDARPFVHFARRFGVRIIAGNAMAVNENCASYVRLVFKAEPDVIERGILRLRDAWHAFPGGALSEPAPEEPVVI